MKVPNGSEWLGVNPAFQAVWEAFHPVVDGIAAVNQAVAA